jgi:glycosyltransferase involved in cell wall biosynthesis
VGVRFRILIPVFNREKHLQQGIDSVLAQTFKNFEILAIDDGSTDGSADRLPSYGGKIKFLQQSNQGSEVARNCAAALARGEYLAFLDSDDFFFPFALATFDAVTRRFEAPPFIRRYQSLRSSTPKNHRSSNN